MKNKVSSLIAEGILFCGSGILLLSYSLISYAKAFNKSWSQSPYLFPALVGAALIGLSIWIMGQGVLAMKRAGNGITLKEKTDSKGKMARVWECWCFVDFIIWFWERFQFRGLRSES